MTFTLKEKISVTVLLFLTYLIPAVPEWLNHSSHHFEMITISAPIWLICFYIGPFWLHYGLTKISFVNRLHVVIKGIIFIALMFLGAVLVNELHLLASPYFQFTFAEQVTSAVLWGVFFFSMTQLYMMYLRLEQERRLREQVQWINLNNRLNPHFLFNSLNTISALMYQSTEQADEVLQKLSDILRYSLDKQTEQVSFDYEITICKTYLAIEKARFTDNLDITWLYDETQVRDIKVPPLLLQQLIENAIKHVKTRPIKITISAEIKQTNLVCEVADNGQGFSQQQLEATLSDRPQTRKGHGLDIAAQRLSLVGGRLILSNRGGARCQVILPIKACE